MELSDLVTFSAVARLGGITRAAAELNTVQSNITQRVKALEAEIGTALFERHSRGMTLTGAGRRLLPYAQRMAALSREAVLAARDDGEPRGPLAIGSLETTAAVRLPLAARRISPAFSGGATEPADRDHRRSRRRRARRLARRRLRRRPDRACRTRRRRRPSGKSWCWSRRGTGKALRTLRAGTPASGPTALVFRTGCTYRQRLEQVLNEFGWPSGGALRTRHARRHDRLRRRRHGRHAVAARRRRAPRSRREHPPPCAQGVAVAGRYPLHPAPRRASIQRVAGPRILPGETGSRVIAA